MPDIKPEAIGGEDVNSVDARALHAALGSKQDYSTWVKNRIEQCKFKQDVDFVQFHNFVESNSKPRIEYALSLDAAKHFAMMERNERGHAVRQYFIDFEKQVRSSALPLPKRRPEPKISPQYKEAQGVLQAMMAMGKMSLRSPIWASAPARQFWGAAQK